MEKKLGLSGSELAALYRTTAADANDVTPWRSRPALLQPCNYCSVRPYSTRGLRTEDDLINGEGFTVCASQSHLEGTGIAFSSCSTP